MTDVYPRATKRSEADWALILTRSLQKKVKQKYPEFWSGESTFVIEIPQKKTVLSGADGMKYWTK